jgi:hypothetical protein
MFSCRDSNQTCKIQLLETVLLVSSNFEECPEIILTSISSRMTNVRSRQAAAAAVHEYHQADDVG